MFTGQKVNIQKVLGLIPDELLASARLILQLRRLAPVGVELYSTPLSCLDFQS